VQTAVLLCRNSKRRKEEYPFGINVPQTKNENKYVESDEENLELERDGWEYVESDRKYREGER